MCGDLDDGEQIGRDLTERLRVMARILGVTPDAAPAAGPRGLATAKGRGAYMDALFFRGADTRAGRYGGGRA